MAAKKPKNTSWGSVADWYDEYLEGNADNYQSAVIAPNLLRILGLKEDDSLIDIACGQGFFTRLFGEASAHVVGADISKELIDAAKQHSPQIEFHVAPADDLSFAKSDSFDAATIILAIQNIENLTGAFAEAARVLKPDGKLMLVMNHPAFRIPKRSSWGWDETEKIQYRRMDGYLSASSEAIEMHPGQEGNARTISYHRSLQDFFKALSKAGFTIARLEEWISHKTSEEGPRQAAEDAARKEFPLFLMIEAHKM